MSNPKKKIIMNEIAFWKQNKMLPDHYCDFLMTLYSEGNNDQQIEGNTKEAIRNVEKRKKLSMSIPFPILSAVLITLLFTIQYEWVVIAITGIFAVSFLVGAFYFAHKNKLLATMLQLATALLLLGVTVKICVTYFSGNNEMLYGLLLANCIIWLLSGIFMKIIYFTISGAVGLIVIIAAWLNFF